MNITPPFKIMAMHDLCAYGRSSLGAVMAVLPSLNCQVCALPTALLSSHFGFKTIPTVLNLGEELKKFIPTWKEAGFQFDSFYSGYLADPSQGETALSYIKEFKPRFVYVDPVLGDEGKLYHGFDKNQIEAMKKLVSYADVISPNFTEACFLLDKDPSLATSQEEVKDMLVKLAQKGAKYVAITGISLVSNQQISVYAFDSVQGKFYKITTKKIDKWYHGTGDTFASVVLGNMLNGIGFIDSINIAMTYLYKALELALQFGTEICLEPILNYIVEKKKDSLVEEL